MSRNALIVLITAFIALFITKFSSEEVPFYLSEKVPAGIPSFELPQFTARIDNTTTVDFIEIASDIGSGFFLVPLVSILANVAIAKSFCMIDRVLFILSYLPTVII